MSYLSTRTSEVYKEALQATEDIESPAEGFVRPENSPTSSQLCKIIKQNNTIIQILVKICEKVEDQEEVLNHLKGLVKTKPGQSNGSIDETIHNIQKKLEGLKIGTGGQNSSAVIQASRKHYVFKDPKQIFDSEREKLKKLKDGQ